MIGGNVAVIRGAELWVGLPTDRCSIWRRANFIFCFYFFLLFIYIFIYSFIHSFFRSFIHSFILSFIHSFVRSFVPSFVHSFLHSFILSFMHSFFRSLVPSFVHSFVRSFIHSFIHSFSSTCPGRSCDQPNSHFTGCLKLFRQGLKRPGPEADQSPPQSLLGCLQCRRTSRKDSFNLCKIQHRLVAHNFVD